jgi:hypothetical protein
MVMQEDANSVRDANPVFKDIKDRLEKASSKKVGLFFIERHKRVEKQKEENNGSTDPKPNSEKGDGNAISYEVLSTEITEDIGKTFKEIGRNKVETLLEISGLKLKKYNPGVDTDQFVIEYIAVNEVSYLQEIYKDLKSLDLHSFIIGESGVPWFLAVNMEDEGLILFRKFTPSRILENKGLIPLFERDGVFNRLQEPALTVDREIDCIYDVTREEIYIFDRAQFETIFSFMEMFMAQVESNKPILARQDLVDNTDLLVELCKSDPRKVRKLHSTLKSPALKLISKADLKGVYDEYVLDLEFTETGQVVVEQKNLWTILRALDDAYLLSTMTDIH